MDLFLQDLFQFCCVCEQLHGWTSATYMVLNTATTADMTANCDDDENNANKWHTTMINLFKDFEKIHLGTMKELAESVWTSNDVTLAASNGGQSQTYACKAFLEFLFASVASNLQKSVQNSISNPSCGTMVLTCGLS